MKHHIHIFSPIFISIVFLLAGCSNPALLSNRVGIAVHMQDGDQAFKQNEQDVFSRLAGTYHRMYGRNALWPVKGAHEGRIIATCRPSCLDNSPGESDSVYIDDQAGFNDRFIKKVIRLLGKVSFDTCGTHTYEIIFSRDVNYAVADTARNRFLILIATEEKGSVMLRSSNW